MFSVTKQLKYKRITQNMKIMDISTSNAKNECEEEGKV